MSLELATDTNEYTVKILAIELARKDAVNAVVPELERGLTFLEQLTALYGQSCSKPNVPYFYRVDETTKRVQFVKGTCKQWDCPSCAARNAKKWIARIIDGCNKLDTEWYFCTITAHKSWRGKNSSLKNLRANWHKVRKRYARLAKAQGKTLHYVRVWEAHKDGSFHMHFIVNVKRTMKELKGMAAECGLGFEAHTDEVKNAGQVAGYVAKYMIKSIPNHSVYPKGARRIEVSAQWVSWHPKTDEWRIALDVLAASNIAKSYKNHGYSVDDLSIRNELKRQRKEKN